MLPTYDFKCNACSNLKEFNSIEPQACDICGEMMVRIYSAVPVHFRGTGFYKTGG